MKIHARYAVKNIKNNVGEPFNGVEIGVWRGALSSVLLRAFPDLRLYMVDQWRPFDPATAFYRMSKQGKTDAVKFERVRQEAIQSVAFSDGRGIPIQATTHDADSVVPHELDFAFLDAGHTYEETRDEINRWWLHVRNGGLLMGHDYRSIRDRTANGTDGVERAAKEFGDRENIEISHGPGLLWWTLKP